MWLIPTEIVTNPRRAAEILRLGGIVAVPTETVYGLAARYDNVQAVERVFWAKGRPADNPLIVHLAERSWLASISDHVSAEAEALLDRFSPGPITVTVPRGATVSDRITGGLPSVAVRIPAEPTVTAVLRALGIPLVAPSANRSGRPSPTTWEAVKEELDGRIDAILVGEPSRIGIESTVVDCCQLPPVLLRPGSVSLEEIAEVLPNIEVLDPIHMADPHHAVAQSVASPGLRYRHYAPAARVVLVDGEEEILERHQCGYLGLASVPHAESFSLYRVFKTADEYARWLFSSFREADQLGLARLYCQRIPLVGIGRGLMDRMERAAKG